MSLRDDMEAPLEQLAAMHARTSTEIFKSAEERVREALAAENPMVCVSVLLELAAYHMNFMPAPDAITRRGMAHAMLAHALERRLILEGMLTSRHDLNELTKERK